MFKSQLVLMQFIDSKGNRSNPFACNPNNFPQRVEGFNDEMRNETLVLVLADAKADPSGDFVISGISRFPITDVAFFCDLANSTVIHSEFSLETEVPVYGDVSAGV